MRSVRIPTSEWRAVTGDRSWLKTELTVSGVSLHLDAIEVMVANGVQTDYDETGDFVALVHEAVGADGPWETLRIDEREYVLIATPFC